MSKVLFTLPNWIEARYPKAKVHVDKLARSILANAFRGELVPIEAQLAEVEGRTFESAADLLARIRAGRAADKNSKRRKAYV